MTRAKKVAVIAIASVATISLSLGIISIIPPYDDEWSKIRVEPGRACRDLSFYGRYCAGAAERVRQSCDSMTTMADVKRFARTLTMLCLHN